MSVLPRLFQRLWRRLTGQEAIPEPVKPLGLAGLESLIAQHDLVIFADRQHSNPAHREFMGDPRTLAMLKRQGINHIGVEIPENMTPVSHPDHFKGSAEVMARRYAVAVERQLIADPSTPDDYRQELAGTSRSKLELRREAIAHYLPTMKMIASMNSAEIKPVFCDHSADNDFFVDLVAHKVRRQSIADNVLPFQRLAAKVDFSKNKGAIFYGTAHAPALKQIAEQAGLSVVIIHLQPQRYDLKALAADDREQAIRDTGGKASPAVSNVMSDHVHYTISTGEIDDLRRKTPAAGSRPSPRHRPSKAKTRTAVST